MPVAVNVAVVELGPVSVHATDTPVATVPDVMVYPEGIVPCNKLATSVQLATALPKEEFAFLAA